MNKTLFTLSHGYVFMRTAKVQNEQGKMTIINEPVFRGNAEVYANKLVKSHGVAEAIKLVDSLSSKDNFWLNVRKILALKVKVR